MMKFFYQFEEHEPTVEVILSSQSELSEVLEQFENFLRGAGYQFNGQLDIVEPEPEITEK